MMIVSFPRSGQHLLESIFRHLCESVGVDFTYCEHYICCKSYPCLKGHKVSKNHDFKLDIEIRDDDKYIALYRNDMILQLESYYRYDIKLRGVEYDYDDLLRFIMSRKDYYQKFLDKWILNSSQNIVKIRY